MRLAALRLVHYRGFDYLDVELGRSTILIGPNNAGKTTLVEAIRYVLGDCEYSRFMRPTRAEFVDDGYVLAVLSDLTPEETATWHPFIRAGQVWLARPLPPFYPWRDEETPLDDGHWIVTDGAGVARIAEAIAWGSGEASPTEDPPRIPDNVHRRRVREEWWIRFEDVVGHLHRSGQALQRQLKLPEIHWLPGPERAPADPLALVARALRARLLSQDIPRIPPLPSLGLTGPQVLQHAEVCVDHLIKWMEHEAISALKGPIRTYVPGAREISMRTPPGVWINFERREWLPHAREVLLRVFEEGELSVQIDTESEVSDDWPPVSALGSGAQRAAAMAALEVFLLPEWCGAKGSGTILIIEEPEAGLHPSALRRLTRESRSLSPPIRPQSSMR
jgi:hypothetical protein